MDDTPSRLCPRRRCAAAGGGEAEGAVEGAGGRIRDDRCGAASPPLWFRRKRTNASRGRMAGRQDFFGKPARVLFCSLPKAAAPFMPAFIVVSRQKPRRRIGRRFGIDFPCPLWYNNRHSERKRTSRVRCLRLSAVEHPLLTEGCKLPSPLRAPRADQNWETRRRRRCVRKYIRFAPQSAWKVF